jgi:hypothetical protein
MHSVLRSTLALLAASLAVAGCNASSVTAPIGVANSAHTRPATGTKSPAEIFNQILPYPQPCENGTGTCPTDFEVTFDGNVTSDIPSNEPLNTHENAFCNGTSSCAPSVTYNPSSNTTTVEWSGTTLYHNRVSGQPGVHFGIIAGRNEKVSIKDLEAASYWTYPSSPQGPQPIISVNVSKQPSTSSNWAYAVVYVAGTTAQGSSASDYASWNEIAYVPNPSGAQPEFTFKNYGTQTIYVQSSGIVLNQSVPTDPECQKEPDCSENMTLLGNLQEDDFPPPGSPSSPFVPLTHPPSKTLKPSG